MLGLGGVAFRDAVVVGVVDDAEVDLVLEHLDIGDLLGSERVLDGLPETVRVVLHSLVDLDRMGVLQSVNYNRLLL